MSSGVEQLISEPISNGRRQRARFGPDLAHLADFFVERHRGKEPFDFGVSIGSGRIEFRNDWIRLRLDDRRCRFFSPKLRGCNLRPDNRHERE
jgi:hypothetical protein